MKYLKRSRRAHTFISTKYLRRSRRAHINYNDWKRNFLFVTLPAAESVGVNVDPPAMLEDSIGPIIAVVQNHF
jgi:hypothetical protein